MAQIKISLVGDVRQFVSSFKKGKESVEDIADELEDLAKEGDQTERSFEQNFKAIARDADKAGKGIKSGIKDGLDDAKKEAGQSGREAAASFSGGFEDVADFAQETLANALGGFGPIGAAAGTALAVALGAALAGASDAQEKLQEAREAAIDLSRTLYENGGDLPLEDAISSLFDTLAKEVRANGPIQAMIDGFVDFGSRVDAVKRSATLLRTPLRDLSTALSGTDLAESERVLGLVNDKLREMKSNVSTGWVWETAPLEDLKTQLETTIESARIADEALQVVGSGFDSQAYRDQVDAIGQAWQDAMVDASAYVSEQDGVTTFDWSAYLEDAESTLAAANEYKRQILTVPPDVKAEAERIFSDQGAKAASAYLSAYDSASVKDRSRFIAAARQNGEAAGTAQGEALAKKTREKAQDTASAAPPVVVPVKPSSIDWTSIVRSPPTVYIPGVIVKPGTRQPL